MSYRLSKSNHQILKSINLKPKLYTFEVKKYYKVYTNQDLSFLCIVQEPGSPPIVIQYKDKIEAILNKNRLTLNSKLCIDSSASLPRKEKTDVGQENSEINNTLQKPVNLKNILEICLTYV